VIHPDQIVRLNVVGDVSHFGDNDKCRPCLVQIDERGRYVMTTAKLAHELLCNLPSGLALREVNAELADALGPLKPEPGINLRQLQEAQYAAMQPPSKNQIVAETLAQYREATGYDV
jgi:hypothetical protein